MKLKHVELSIVFGFLICSATVSMAQEKRPPEPPAGFKEKVEKVRAECQDDIKKFCSNEDGDRKGPPKWLFCLFEHKDEVSKKCQKALDELPPPPKHPRRPPRDDEESNGIQSKKPGVIYFKNSRPGSGAAKAAQ